MHTNEKLIHKFYSAFREKDAETMISCYHPEVEFNDPVFRNLKGAEAKAMWKMLVSRGKDLRIIYGNVKADDEKGSAEWEAEYSFSKTGRKVHNVIRAEFVFRDGLIWKHNDHFNLWRWAGMALGPAGKWLGGTFLVRDKIRKQARESLDKYLRS